MHTEKMTLSEAWNHMKDSRPQVAPHEGYIHQLREYEKKLFGKMTLESQAFTHPISLSQRIEDWRNMHRKNGSLPSSLCSSSNSDDSETDLHKLEKERRSCTSPIITQESLKRNSEEDGTACGSQDHSSSSGTLANTASKFVPPRLKRSKQ